MSLALGVALGIPLGICLGVLLLVLAATVPMRQLMPKRSGEWPRPRISEAPPMRQPEFPL